MTYDAIQMAAVLIVCAGCKRAFYMTVVASKCLRCRRADQQGESVTA